MLATVIGCRVSYRRGPDWRDRFAADKLSDMSKLNGHTHASRAGLWSAGVPRWRAVHHMRCFAWLLLLNVAAGTGAQQFNSDKRSVALYDIGTGVLANGKEYSAALMVAAPAPELEFNVGVTRYPGRSKGLNESRDTDLSYVKHRRWENGQQAYGMAFLIGAGIDPSHLEAGKVIGIFKSWWGNFVYTTPFNDGGVACGLLPGIS